MSYTHTKPHRHRAASSWLLIGACALIGLAACSPTSTSNGGPAKIPLTVSYRFIGAQDLHVTVARGTDASLTEDLDITVTLMPSSGDAITEMVTLRRVANNVMITFPDLTDDAYTLSVTATGTEVNIEGGATVKVADLGVTWMVQGTNLIVTVAVSGGSDNASDTETLVTVTLTSEDGSFTSSKPATIPAGNTTKAVAFIGLSPATYTLTASHAGELTVKVDDPTVVIGS